MTDPTEPRHWLDRARARLADGVPLAEVLRESGDPNRLLDELWRYARQGEREAGESALTLSELAEREERRGERLRRREAGFEGGT